MFQAGRGMLKLFKKEIKYVLKEHSPLAKGYRNIEN